MKIICVFISTGLSIPVDGQISNKVENLEFENFEIVDKKPSNRKKLTKLINNLDKIEKGLQKDGKIWEALKVRAVRNVVATIRDYPRDDEFYRLQVEECLRRGLPIVRKYRKYLKRDEEVMSLLTEDDGDDLQKQKEKLAKMVQDLVTIEKGLKKDKRLLEAVNVRIIRAIADAVLKYEKDTKFHRQQIKECLMRGEPIVKKYENYLKEKEVEFNLLIADDADDDTDDDGDKDGDKDGDLEKDKQRLAKMVQDLEKIEAGLIKDKRYVEVINIRIIKGIADAVLKYKKDTKFHRQQIKECLMRGEPIVKKYERYLKEDTVEFNLLAADDKEGDKDDDKDGDKDGDLEKQKKKLAKMVQDLLTIEKGLKKDKRLLEAVNVRIIRAIADAVLKYKKDTKFHRQQIKECLMRGEPIVKKYENYLKENTIEMLAFDDEDEHDNELLGALIHNLERIEAGLKNDGKSLESIRITIFKNIVKALKNNRSDSDYYRKAVKKILQRGEALTKKYEQYLDHDLDHPSILNLDFDDEIPEDEDHNDEKHGKNLAILMKLKQRLAHLKDELAKRKWFARVTIVKVLIKGCDDLIEKLERHELNDTALSAFLKKANDILKRYEEDLD